MSGVVRKDRLFTPYTKLLLLLLVCTTFLASLGLEISSSCFAAIFMALGDVVDVDSSSFCCSFLLVFGVVISDSVVVIAGVVVSLTRYGVAREMSSPPPTLLLLLPLFVFI